ncbi:MAG: hypothetical protein K2X99_04395 [Gemmatimonadaceae bacterium]|nr:hypothetical protein [Gemmatimonadaceae bacterium]
MKTTLRLLGGIGCEGLPPARAAKLVGQPKRLALLAYVLLARRGTIVSRDQLLSVFWPDSTEDRARNALRQTLSFLRLCLGPRAILSTGTQGVTLAPSIERDVLRFESLLDQGQSEQALTQYRGELLPGFYIKGSSQFQDWLDRRRQQLSQRAAKAAWDLSARFEGGEDWTNAAFWGKRALALSPFSESEVQRLLGLLERVGDGAGAARTFRGLQRQMRAEFGMEPSIETLRLFERIRDRTQAAQQPISAAGSPRRTVADRRAGERRAVQRAFRGPDRRGKRDRRTEERRSGVDRRTI